MFERKVVDKAKIRTIYKSETFPTTSYGIAHNLDPALAAKIKEAFFTFPWEGSALKAEFKTEDRFVPITYQKDWSVIRKIDAATRREIHVQVNSACGVHDMLRNGSLTVTAALAGALVAVRRRARAGGLPARHARQGLLRPQRRSHRRPADRSEEDRQSVDADLRLHADRRPGGLSEGVGRLPQEPGEDDRQEGGVLPGAVERRAIRGDALGPAAYRRRQRRRQCARGELRGLRAVRDDGVEGQQLRLRDGNHRAGRQPDQDAGRSQGPQDRVHRRDVELGLQGAVGDPQGRLQSRGQARLRAGVLRQARQLDPRRRQQGLRGGGGGQFGAQPDDRPQGVRPGENPLDLQVARRSRPPATATPTTSIRSSSRRSRRPSSTSPGRARRWPAEFKKEGKFIPIDYKKDWAVLRKIDEATGVKYTCK